MKNQNKATTGRQSIFFVTSFLFTFNSKFPRRVGGDKKDFLCICSLLFDSKLPLKYLKILVLCVLSLSYILTDWQFERKRVLLSYWTFSNPKMYLYNKKKMFKSIGMHFRQLSATYNNYTPICFLRKENYLINPYRKVDSGLAFCSTLSKRTQHNNKCMQCWGTCSNRIQYLLKSILVVYFF